jgi:hypothetical protein
MWVSKEFYFFVRWGCFNFFWVGLCVAKVWFSVKEQRKCQPNKSRPKDLFEFVCLVVFESVFCCRVGSLRLLPTFGRYTKVAISKHFTVNQAQTLIEALHLI